MTLTPRQWIMAFAAALTTHALAAGLLPQALSSRRNDPPPPKPVLVSLATTPVLPMPAATPPPAPVRPTPPVARQPEPKVTPPTPEVAPPQPAPVPIAVNPTPVATPQAPPSTPTAAVSSDDRTPRQEAPSTPTIAVAPTPAADAVDLAQLRDQYGKAAHHWLNKHKRYPRRAEYRGDEGTVLVTFVVNRHGEVLSYELERSSGNTLLDKEALALIKRAQPLPVFPDELANVKDTITVLVTIPFKLR